MLGVLLLGSLVSKCWAYGIGAHSELTRIAVEHEERVEELLERLTFDGDVEDAIELLVRGAKEEDDTFRIGDDDLFDLRYMRHFHDPVRNRGLVFAGAVRESSAFWAQGEGTADPTKSNFQAWPLAREALLRALEAPLPVERNTVYRGRFSILEDEPTRGQGLFRAVGQLMHLLQDAAVPPHTRNDPHAKFDVRAGDHRAVLGDPSLFEVFIRDAEVKTRGVPEAISAAYPSEVPLDDARLGLPVPVSNLWDIDAYVDEATCEGLAPGQVGLSEVSSAHFFSDDTVPGRSSEYPCPIIAGGDMQSDAIHWDCDSDPPYCRYVVPGIGLSVERAIRRSALGFSSWTIDKEVALRQADHLVPLAIAYSARLFDYFFRGMFKLSATVSIDTGEITLRNAPHPLFDREDFEGGTIEVYYDSEDKRRRVFYASVDSVTIPEGGVVRLGGIDARGMLADLDGAVVFTYRGRLGHEEASTAGYTCRAASDCFVTSPPGCEGASGWYPMPGLSSSSTVRAIAVDQNGAVYAGGTSTRPVSVSSGDYVVKWDGSSWITLGGELTDGFIAESVNAIVVGQDGDVYAGGDFEVAGGTTVNHVARWDGFAWSALGQGVGGGGLGFGDDLILALAAARDGSLYAGGTFTRADGERADRLARWDGVGWAEVGNGVGNFGLPHDPIFPSVSALAVWPDGTLFVGGNFGTAGGFDIENFGVRSGNQWFGLGNPNGEVLAIATKPDLAIYAGGVFDEAGLNDVEVAHIASYLGQGRYGPLSTGTDAVVRALTLADDGTLYVGGSFSTAGGIAANRIAMWDGADWSALGAGANGTIYAVAVAEDGTLYAGGSFSMVDGIPASGIARYCPGG